MVARVAAAASGLAADEAADADFARLYSLDDIVNLSDISRFAPDELHRGAAATLGRRDEALDQLFRSQSAPGNPAGNKIHPELSGSADGSPRVQGQGHSQESLTAPMPDGGSAKRKVKRKGGGGWIRVSLAPTVVSDSAGQPAGAAADIHMPYGGPKPGKARESYVVGSPGRGSYSVGSPGRSYMVGSPSPPSGRKGHFTLSREGMRAFDLAAGAGATVGSESPRTAAAETKDELPERQAKTGGHEGCNSEEQAVKQGGMGTEHVQVSGCREGRAGSGTLDQLLEMAEQSVHEGDGKEEASLRAGDEQGGAKVQQEAHEAEAVHALPDKEAEHARGEQSSKPVSDPTPWEEEDVPVLSASALRRQAWALLEEGGLLAEDVDWKGSEEDSLRLVPGKGGKPNGRLWDVGLPPGLRMPGLPAVSEGEEEEVLRAEEEREEEERRTGAAELYMPEPLAAEVDSQQAEGTKAVCSRSAHVEVRIVDVSEMEVAAHNSKAGHKAPEPGDMHFGFMVGISIPAASELGSASGAEKGAAGPKQDAASTTTSGAEEASAEAQQQTEGQRDTPRICESAKTEALADHGLSTTEDAVMVDTAESTTKELPEAHGLEDLATELPAPTPTPAGAGASASEGEDEDPRPEPLLASEDHAFEVQTSGEPEPAAFRQYNVNAGSYDKQAGGGGSQIAFTTRGSQGSSCHSVICEQCRRPLCNGGRGESPDYRRDDFSTWSSRATTPGMTEGRELDALVRQLAADDSMSARLRVAALVSTLAKESHVAQERLRTAGGPAALVALLRNCIVAEDWAGCETSLLGLLNLAVGNEASKLDIYREGAADALCNLLQTAATLPPPFPPPLAAAAGGMAVALLLTLSASSSVRPELGHFGVILPLVELLQSPDKQTRSDVLWALLNLSLASSARGPIVKAGGVPLLLALLRREPPGSGQSRQLKLLLRLAEERVGVESIVAVGGVSVLVGVMRSAEEEGKLLAAATLLLVCATSPENRKVAIAEKAVAVAVELRLMGSSAVQLQAGRLLDCLLRGRDPGPSFPLSSSPRILARSKSDIGAWQAQEVSVRSREIGTPSRLMDAFRQPSMSEDRKASRRLPEDRRTESWDEGAETEEEGGPATSAVSSGAAHRGNGSKHDRDGRMSATREQSMDFNPWTPTAELFRSISVPAYNASPRSSPVADVKRSAQAGRGTPRNGISKLAPAAVGCKAPNAAQVKKGDDWKADASANAIAKQGPGSEHSSNPSIKSNQTGMQPRAKRQPSKSMDWNVAMRCASLAVDGEESDVGGEPVARSQGRETMTLEEARRKGWSVPHQSTTPNARSNNHVPKQPRGDIQRLQRTASMGKALLMGSLFRCAGGLRNMEAAEA